MFQAVETFHHPVTATIHIQAFVRTSPKKDGLFWLRGNCIGFGYRSSMESDAQHWLSSSDLGLHYLRKMIVFVLKVGIVAAVVQAPPTTKSKITGY